MVYQSWRVWDGTSALAGAPQATPEALTKAYKLDSAKQLIIYKDDSGNENNVRVYSSTVSIDKIQADFDAEVAQQRAAKEAAKQPTMEDRIAALEAAQVAALGV